MLVSEEETDPFSLDLDAYCLSNSLVCSLYQQNSAKRSRMWPHGVLAVVFLLFLVFGESQKSESLQILNTDSNMQVVLTLQSSRHAMLVQMFEGQLSISAPSYNAVSAAVCRGVSPCARRPVTRCRVTRCPSDSLPNVTRCQM